MPPDFPVSICVNSAGWAREYPVVAHSVISRHLNHRPKIAILHEAKTCIASCFPGYATIVAVAG
jgi:hypothetical protein